MSKWIDLETDASTGKPYLWKCDECGEEVETRWNYCPECGDPKTSKGKSINTLVKALEAEHKKLREMQSATDKNVGTKYDELEIVRAIDGLSEWQKHVQTDSNIDRDITVAIEALKAQLGTNLAEVGMDTISRQQAIDAIENAFDRETILNRFVRKIAISAVRLLPPAQPAQHHDEWCTDCKEYDTDRHCCPRWIKVIRQTLADAQPQRTGKWKNIVEGIEYACGTCDTCGVRIPMAYKYYEYCTHCGMKNEVEHDE